MVVKFIKYHVLFAHDVNDVCELTDADAERLIASGHVEPVEEKTGKSEKPAKSKPKQ
jgi:DNA-binding ferritin-like protein